MVSKQKGFTIIELVVVIVILGILSAVAFPRFVNLTTDARVAAVQGFAGGIRSAVGMTQARYFATGNNAAVSVTMADATTIAVAAGNGIPTGATGGIGDAIAGDAGCPDATVGGCQGFTADFTTATAVTFRPTNGGSATCGITYDGTTGLAAVVTTGC